MDAEEGQAGARNRTARHFRSRELFADIAETRLEALIADLFDLPECIEKGFKALGVDREGIQLHAETNARQGGPGLRKSIRQAYRGEDSAGGKGPQQLQYLSSSTQIHEDCYPGSRIKKR